MSYRNSDGGGCMVVIGAIAIVGIIGINAANYFTTGESGPCVVDSKDRTSKPKGGSDMRIYTDCGVFQVRDDLFRGHMDSADRYAQIDEGVAYTFDTVGIRFPLLSMFPNIIDAEPVS